MAMSKDERRARNAAYMAEYRKRNADKIAAYLKQYRAENAETARAYALDYYQRTKDTLRAEYQATNKDRLLAADAARRDANREKRRQQWLEWKRANPEKARANSRNRRARKRGAAGKLSPGIVEKLMTLQRFRCANCAGDLRRLGHNLDHIQPLAKGGTNTDGNMQLLCPRCNMRKHAKDPIKWAQQNGRLL